MFIDHCILFLKANLNNSCHRLSADPLHLTVSLCARDDIGIYEDSLFWQSLMGEGRLDYLTFSIFPVSTCSKTQQEWTQSKYPVQSIEKCPSPVGFLQLISTLYFSFVNILLPYDAKTIGTRFRWWQPKHDGLDQNDWAIDNVLISGSADQRTVMLDTFSSAPLPQHERSPADAGPTGRIAFDMFMEDKTTGKNSKWIWIKEQGVSTEISNSCCASESLSPVTDVIDNPITMSIFAAFFFFFCLVVIVVHKMQNKSMQCNFSLF